MSLVTVVCKTGLRRPNTAVVLLMSVLLALLFLPSAASAIESSPSSLIERVGIEIPHGGYDLNSDACDQCHDINETSGDFVLSRWRTLADVCGSCHYLYKTSGMKLPARPNPPGTPKTRVDHYLGAKTSGRPTQNEQASPPAENGISVGSQHSAYKFNLTDDRPFSEHALQRGPGTWRYNDDPDKFWSADHLPGGSGRLRGVLNNAPLMGLSCSSCHTSHIKSSRRLAVVSVGGEAAGTILSSPNISSRGSDLRGSDYTGGQTQSSLIKNNWAFDGGQWCAECHDKLFEQTHNHPGITCLQCHSGAVDNPTEQPNDDFPHTSYNPNLLTNEGDALCLTCHVPGSIP